jgi:hypothetical protein
MGLRMPKRHLPPFTYVPIDIAPIACETAAEQKRISSSVLGSLLT